MLAQLRRPKQGAGPLVACLRHTCGFAGSALQWITLYLTDRSQFVRCNGATSNVTSVMCGVPQGSVLGPVLFLLYVVEVIQLVKNCGFCPHAFADDLQVYGHALPTDSTKLLGRLAACIERVQAWMASNRLLLNSTKNRIHMAWIDPSATDVHFCAAVRFRCQYSTVSACP